VHTEQGNKPRSWELGEPLRGAWHCGRPARERGFEWHGGGRVQMGGPCSNLFVIAFLLVDSILALPKPLTLRVDEPLAPQPLAPAELSVRDVRLESQEWQARYMALFCSPCTLETLLAHATHLRPLILSHAPPPSHTLLQASTASKADRCSQLTASPMPQLNSSQLAADFTWIEVERFAMHSGVAYKEGFQADLPPTGVGTGCWFYPV
jgi:hypothetical protein